MNYPIIVFHSSYGHIPNLSLDLMMQDFNDDNEKSLLLHVDIGHLIQKSFCDLPINVIINRNGLNNKLMYSPRHMKGKESFITSKGVSIDGPGGRRQITNLDYLKRISIDKPNVAISMADHIKIPDRSKNTLNSNDIKKAKVAIERTNNWFNELKNCERIDRNVTKLFGVALATPIIDKISDDEKTCRYDTTESVIQLIDNSVDGIVVGGSFIDELLEDLLQTIREVKSLIDKNNKSGKYIPVMVQGARTLYDLVACVTAGADIISTSYPSELSQNGHAIMLSTILTKKRKFDEKITDSQSTVIDLNDAKFEEDIYPLTPECKCHCCSNHSRAYVHHLLKAKEMLAESLLQSHNHYQFLLLFSWLREKNNNGDIRFIGLR